MTAIQIIKQLLNGQHLEPKELKEAQKIVDRLQTELKTRKI